MEKFDKNFFKSKSYEFYPKGVDFYLKEEDYKETKEHLNLLNTINKFNKDKVGISSSIKKIELEENFQFRDYSMDEIGDRCLNFQIIKRSEDFFISLCFNVSLLIPFYHNYCLITYLDKDSIGWKGYPELLNIKDDDYLIALSEAGENILKSNYNYNQFPVSIINERIPDISFYDIRHDNLTFFNAFFLTDYYTRI